MRLFRNSPSSHFALIFIVLIVSIIPCSKQHGDHDKHGHLPQDGESFTELSWTFLDHVASKSEQTLSDAMRSQALYAENIGAKSATLAT